RRGRARALERPRPWRLEKTPQATGNSDSPAWCRRRPCRRRGGIRWVERDGPPEVLDALLKADFRAFVPGEAPAQVRFIRARLDRARIRAEHPRRQLDLDLTSDGRRELALERQHV